jgi:Beta-lactamase/Domain of unknown function (DUF4440)
MKSKKQIVNSFVVVLLTIIVICEFSVRLIKVLPIQFMKNLLSIVLLFLTASITMAQVDPKSELFKTLEVKDNLLFNQGFNNCDISQFQNLVSNNFEFYHDKGGLTASKTAFIESIKTGICKMSNKARRELMVGSLEVYPLEKAGVLYGAIQIGQHRFYETEKDKPERLTSIAKFTHLWLLENGEWKLSRVLSYDHQVNIDEKNNAKLFHDKDITEKWLIDNNIPAVGIGYIKNGEISEIKLFGEHQKGKVAPTNAIFNVASLTKPVTAMVALKLVSQGKLNLDEPLDRYWIDPDIADNPWHKKITTRIILSHQTGFANWRRLNKSKKLEFAFEPGTKYQYSGEGFEYLRIALEKKFNKSLEKLADELIFRPLKMNDSHLIWDEKIDETRFAIGYDKTGLAYETVKRKKANAADD